MGFSWTFLSKHTAKKHKNVYIYSLCFKCEVYLVTGDYTNGDLWVPPHNSYALYRQELSCNLPLNNFIYFYTITTLLNFIFVSNRKKICHTLAWSLGHDMGLLNMIWVMTPLCGPHLPLCVGSLDLIQASFTWYWPSWYGALFMIWHPDLLMLAPWLDVGPLIWYRPCIWCSLFLNSIFAY